MKATLRKRELAAIRAWVEQVKHASPDEAPEGGPSLPYKPLAFGKHRLVYDLGNGCVLKLPRVPKGILCSAIEAGVFRHAPRGLRKHLCPVVAAGDGWVVMPKLNRALPARRTYEKKVTRILKKSLDAGVRISDIVGRNSGKPNRDNIRLDAKDRVVLIDYANAYDADNRLLETPGRCRRAFGHGNAAGT